MAICFLEYFWGSKDELEQARESRLYHLFMTKKNLRSGYGREVSYRTDLMGVCNFLLPAVAVLTFQSRNKKYLTSGLKFLT